MSSGHNGHSATNNRARNNRRGRNGPQHVSATPRGPQAMALAPAPRQAPKAPTPQQNNQRPQQPNRGTPPRDGERRQNGHSQNGHSPQGGRPAPQVTRPLAASAPAAQPAPKPSPAEPVAVAKAESAEPAADVPTASELNGHVAPTVSAEAVATEAPLAETPRSEAPHAEVMPVKEHFAASGELLTVLQMERVHPPVTRMAPRAMEYERDDAPETGVQPAVRPQRPERATRERERYQHIPGTVDVRGDVGPLIDDLHAIFERDRSVASQGNTARCGVCYFHYSLAELTYREAEGYYVCPGCEKALGPIRISMVRRQQRN